MSTLSIDAIATVRDPFCSWCGRSDDETGTPMCLFATRHDGHLYWSHPMCSVECHDEACEVTS